MPFVNVRTIKGLLDDEQRKQLQDRITDLLVEIEGRGNPEFRKFVWVLIEDEEPKNWSLGGLHMTDEIIARVTGGK